MKTVSSLFVASIAFAFSVSAIAQTAPDLVCNNLQGMIKQQQKTYAHYRDINYYSHVGAKEAKIHIRADRQLIEADKIKIANLAEQLALEKKYLRHVKEGLARHEHTVKVAKTNLEKIPQDVIDNERQLIVILTDKYRDMCLLKNLDDPAKTPLAMQFYP